MDSANFDRLTRIFAKRISRRFMGAIGGGLVAARFNPTVANQLTPSTCGASGEVCTLLRGCCDGLTCVTSAINTNYGVCVPGDGGTVSVGTQLISPFSEEVEQDIAALANGAVTSDTTSSTTTTTDTEAEREQRIAEKKARKATRRDDQKLRKETQQNEQQDRREDRRNDRELRRGPRLELELFNAGNVDPVETLKVTNHDDDSAVLTAIQSLLDPSTGTDFTTPITLNSGESFLFLSNGSGTDVSGRLGWSHSPICSAGVSGDGLVVVAALSSNSENHEFAVLCDESTDSGTNKRRRKKRKQKAGGDRNRGNSKKNR